MTNFIAELYQLKKVANNKQKVALDLAILALKKERRNHENKKARPH